MPQSEPPRSRSRQGENRPTPISSIVVVIPARNEADTIASALTIVDEASEMLPSIPVDVVVACDRCTDDTALKSKTVRARNCVIHVVESTGWRTVGEVRAAGVRQGLLRATKRNVSLPSVWIANTDADTSVGPRWLVDQLRFANSGVDAVAGIVDLRADGSLSDLTVKVFHEMYSSNRHGHGHGQGHGQGDGHVHGANLGVRACAYEIAGGFPSLARSEDRALWQSLVDSGHRCVASCDVSVQTSGRLVGRVDEGFAYWLAVRQSLAQALTRDKNTPTVSPLAS